MERVDDFDVVVHDGTIGIAADSARFIALADLHVTKQRIDDDLARLFP